MCDNMFKSNSCTNLQVILKPLEGPYSYSFTEYGPYCFPLEHKRRPFCFFLHSERVHGGLNCSYFVSMSRLGHVLCVMYCSLPTM